jgi:hypothetical protein
MPNSNTKAGCPSTRTAAWRPLFLLLAILGAALSACSENPLLAGAETMRAEAVSPRLSVTVGSAALDSCSSCNLGSASVGGEILATLTLGNRGKTVLSIDLDHLAVVADDDLSSGAFSITVLPAKSLAPGGTTACTVAFRPASDGEQAATLTIPTNDVVTPGFVLKLKASGLNSSKALTSFGFQSPQATGTVDEDAKTVTISLPYDKFTTSLIPVFSTTGASVKINGTVQTSGSTAVDFTNPVVYTVFAGDGSPVTYTVTVIREPVVPSLSATLDATSISLNGAYSGGTITSAGGAAMTARGICWTTSDTTLPVCTDSHVSDAANVTGTFNGLYLSGLSSGTTYYVRSYATNSAGTGYGPVMTFCTLPSIPGAPTVAVVRGYGNGDKLDVSWTAVSGNATINYDIYCGTSTAMPADYIATTSTAGSAASPLELTGLTPFTTYYVWVAARDSAGTSRNALNYGTQTTGVKVASIALGKSASSLFVGQRDTLVVTYTPADASDPQVTWSTGSTATFGAIDYAHEYVFAGTSAGTQTVTATPVSSVSETTAAARSCTLTVSSVTVGTTTGPAGGKIFYDAGATGYATLGFRYLEASPFSTTAGVNLRYYPSGYDTTLVTTGTAIGAGKDNTALLVAAFGGATTAYAAGYCDLYTYGGYSDWFMPSIGELVQLNSVLCDFGTSKLRAVWSSSMVDLHSGVTRVYALYNASLAQPYSQTLCSTDSMNCSNYSGWDARPVRQF